MAAVEIAAGLIVAFAPRIGAFVVAGWLGGIVINLLTNNAPQYYERLKRVCALVPQQRDLDSVVEATIQLADLGIQLGDRGIRLLHCQI